MSGVETVKEDMDDPSAPLISQFGHCSQEMLNLLLAGAASSNVFDGAVPMGDRCGGRQRGGAGGR